MNLSKIPSARRYEPLAIKTSLPAFHLIPQMVEISARTHSRSHDPAEANQASINDKIEDPRASFSRWKEDAECPILPSTATFYERCYRGMVGKLLQRLVCDSTFKNATENLPDLDVGRVVEEMLNSDLAPSTKATYRAAAIWACSNPMLVAPGPARESALELLENFGQFEKIKSAGTRQRSRPRGRSILETDLEPLLKCLHSMRESLNTTRRWGRRARTFILAGIASGARPGEWEKAYWYDRQRGILRLPNLKLKKHPPFEWSHFPVRLVEAARFELDGMITEEREQEDYYSRALDEVSPEATEFLVKLRAWEIRNKELAWRDIQIHESERDAVNAQLHHIWQYLAQCPEKTFKDYFNGCRQAVYLACKRTFKDGRLYSLYDTRSLAAANMKAARGIQGAAQAMGHYSVEHRTVQKNYAGPDKAHRAGKICAPRAAATPNQLRFVQIIDEAKEAQADARATRSAIAGRLTSEYSDEGESFDRPSA